ncbi:MAG: ABC transporter permease, partial [Armatimonadota bacterium]|nr:ABC transporter permease [Armatimonadota bacterium]
FIRLPFLFEGMLLGAIGGAIACGLVLGAALYITEVVTRMWPLLASYPGNIEPRQLLAGMVGLGCWIGLVGSFISVRKFLRT